MTRSDATGSEDWRDERRYERLRCIDRAGLMWEWLRRDPDYVAWHARASTATHGTDPMGNPANDPLVWGLHFRRVPDLEAPDARIIWHADVDPGTLRVAVIPAESAGPDRLDIDRLAPWLSIVVDGEGREHAVLSDGWRHVRVDVEAGSLAGGGLVLLEYRLAGLASAEMSASALNQFLRLAIHGRFAASRFPREPRMARWVLLLRVSDALRAGASQREIGRALFGDERVEREWLGPSDSLRSRVRRLVRDARAMARGGYRVLLRRSRGPSGASNNG